MANCAGAMQDFHARLKGILKGCMKGVQFEWANDNCTALSRPYVLMSTSSWDVVGVDYTRYIDNGDGNDLSTEICAQREFVLDLQAFALAGSCGVEPSLLILEDLRISLDAQRTGLLNGIGASLIDENPIVVLDIDGGVSRSQTSFLMQASLGYTSCDVPYIEKVEMTATINDVDDTVVVQQEITVP